MIWKLIFLMALIGIANTSPFSQGDYFSLRARHLEHQAQALELVEQAKLKEMCLKTTGSNDAYKDVEHAADQLKICIKLTVNQVILDYARSKMNEDYTSYYFYPRRTMEPVDIIKGICSKKSDFIQCTENYNKVVGKCMDEKHKKKLAQSERHMKDKLNYICHNDAERVKSFMDNGGLQCFQRKVDELALCGDTLSTDISTIVNPASLASLDIDETATCKYSKKFYDCVVEKMKTCSNKTPANILKDFFDYEQKHSECDQLLPNNNRNNNNNLIEVF